MQCSEYGCNIIRMDKELKHIQLTINKSSFTQINIHSSLFYTYLLYVCALSTTLVAQASSFALKIVFTVPCFAPHPGVLPSLPEPTVQMCHMLGASALLLHKTREHTNILSSCSILGVFGVEGRPLEEGLGREIRRMFGCCTL